MIRVFIGLIILLFYHSLGAETHFEMALGAHDINFHITRKRAENFRDHYQGYSLSASAFRKTSGSNMAWGASIEALRALDRNPLRYGSGHLIGLVPVNLLYQWTARISTEHFIGAAQYRYLKTADGLYFGTNLRFHLKPSVLIALDVRYYNDLAFDDSFGDTIVGGPVLGIKTVYRF